MAIQSGRLGDVMGSRHQILGSLSTHHLGVVPGRKSLQTLRKCSHGGSTGDLLKSCRGVVRILCRSLRSFLNHLKFVKAKKTLLKRNEKKGR